MIKHLSIKTDENQVISEYTPQEEINEKQLRQTIVSLYFVESETGELCPEARLVDIKDLMNLPYDKLMELLIGGPKNDKYTKVIPENTKLLKTYTEGDCLIIDFSTEGDCLVLDVTSDILKYNKEDKNAKENIINSIVNTMTELTEINKVKFLIDGKQNEELKDTYTRKI